MAVVESWPNMSEPSVFLIAVVSHWQSYITGGVVTAIVGVFERLTDWRMSKKSYAVVFLGVFQFVSFYLTWREQYRIAATVPALQDDLQKRDQEIQRLKSNPPHVEVSIPTPV